MTDAGPRDGGPDGSPGPAGARTTYVIDSLVFPTNVQEAAQLAQDIDENGRTENVVGGLLAAIASQGGLDLQALATRQIQDGTALNLVELLSQYSGVRRIHVHFGVFPGDTGSISPAPCTDPNQQATCGQHLQGDGMFHVASGLPTSSDVEGTEVNGHFTGSRGRATFQLPLGGASGPIDIDLIGARVDVMVAEDYLTRGRLAGGVPRDEVTDRVLPAMRDELAAMLADSGCSPASLPCCPDGSVGAVVLSFLDENGDCQVTLDELENNSLIKSTLGNPDLDLLDADGNFNPNTDGVRDSLSLGIGFEAVPGAFPPP